MGRELVAVAGRWDALVGHPCRPEVVAVADPAPGARDWFSRIPTVSTLTRDWRELVDDDGTDLLYLAGAHDPHEEIYLAAAAARGAFLGGQAFRLDLRPARRIAPA